MSGNQRHGSTDRFDVIIVGAGAAGVFAAVTCAGANPARRVLILEQGNTPLAKVRVSGGGRCNVTHACFEPKELVKHYPRGGRELLGPFHGFQPRDTVAWFAAHGVELKTEADGRMFPVTDSSQTIVDCLLGSAKQAGVELRPGTGLAAARRATEGFELTLADQTSLRCTRLMLATGGLKPGPVLEVIKGFGHTIAPLAPSLFTFHIQDPRLEGLPGLSVPAAVVSIPDTTFVHHGPVLITHWGLSGPAILKLSAWAARWAQERNYQFTVRVNWTGLTPDALDARLDEARRAHTSRLVRNTPLGELPGRLWERLVAAAGIPERTPWSQLRREQTTALAGQLAACDLAVTGKSMFKEEFVTCGGVSLKEVHFKTMESKLVPGLHFAGEVLDIDGVTGGFNFQAAWTGGRLAGLAMAE